MVEIEQKLHTPENDTIVITNALYKWNCRGTSVWGLG